MPANAGIVVYEFGLLTVVLLGGQHQASLHDPDLNRRINLKTRLAQPVAPHLNPGHGTIARIRRLRFDAVLIVTLVHLDIPFSFSWSQAAA